MVSRWVQKQMKVAQIPFLDSGLLLSILGMDLGSITTLSEQILIGNATDLVNKGHITEMVAGLEIIKNMPPDSIPSLFFGCAAQRVL